MSWLQGLLIRVIKDFDEMLIDDLPIEANILFHSHANELCTARGFFDLFKMEMWVNTPGIMYYSRSSPCFKETKGSEQLALAGLFTECL
ncbi:hypothetical protein TNIN_273371 [Trichonephila inaurata madagascariensis]|uniref:Uncharacterized protein n=1 Tax=Trichonephila inaurata madagascariensis TaxID=2747483 RepID=A0A8X6YR88_9ARAC|nr:hypothetical protein TNIN_273371 [Trichonephila inaurata madagascariensis]